MTTYCILRFRFDRPGGRKRRGMSGLTLAEAQAHCRRPDTSSTTCPPSKWPQGIPKGTPWFDGYTEEA